VDINNLAELTKEEIGDLNPLSSMKDIQCIIENFPIRKLEVPLFSLINKK
jgi:hypothetical protein